MNLPNCLTISRMFLTVVFIYLLMQDGIVPKIVACIVFTVASLTDYFDGHIAKKHNKTSNFGKLMDPIADKFLILAAFFIFTKMELVALWMFIIIFTREIIITLLRLLAIRKGKYMAAERAGKVKTVFQIVAISFILVGIVIQELYDYWSFPYRIYDILSSFIYVLMIITVFITLFSGISYLWNYRRQIHVI